LTADHFLRPGLDDLERAAAEHWQAADRAALGEWLLRAAGGFTGRANSALPLGDPGLPLGAAADAVTAWYGSRGLPAMIVVPQPLRPSSRAAGGPAAEPEWPASGTAYSLDGLLAARGWTIRPGAALVMTAAIAELAGLRAAMAPGVTVTMTSEPDPGWLSMYHYRGQPLPGDALGLLLSAPWQAFATLAAGGQAAAIGRVSVAAGWAGITAVEVAAGHRRQGLGAAVTAALARAAAERGVDQIFLQVEEDNSAARALYARCGFRDAHTYHYRVAPAAPR
jgi:ribosomal protein S18 acetylase RimI-like enzyme